MENFNENRPVVEPIKGISEIDPNIGKKTSMDTVAMILGIVSAAMCLMCCACGQWYITLCMGLAAIVMSVVAKKNIMASKKKCTVAMVCGIIGVILSVLIGVYLILFTLTDGVFLIQMMMPSLEASGINTAELTSMIESGASLEEIMEWLEAQATALQ